MDYENEIKWQKEVLKTATDKDTILSAQERIAEVEEMLDEIKKS